VVNRPPICGLVLKTARSVSGNEKKPLPIPNVLDRLATNSDAFRRILGAFSMKATQNKPKNSAAASMFSTTRQFKVCALAVIYRKAKYTD
jgi:hypothetical protein